jgi:hypothetical protein
MGANCTYGPCGTYGTCGKFGAYGAFGTFVRYMNEKCGTFVVGGTYVTHVPYSQMVHTSLDLLAEYKYVFTSGSKNKISSNPNV